MTIFLSFLIVFSIAQSTFGNCPPIQKSQGLQANCILPQQSVSLDCFANGLPPGTEMHYGCERFYVEMEGKRKGGRIVCSHQGYWSNFRDFQEFFCIPECGISGNATLNTISSYIEMEHETESEIFPWHAMIFRRFGNTFNNVCGGTLVNPNNKGFFILTAAHCVTTNTISTMAGAIEDFRVVLGATTNEFQYILPEISQILKVKNIVIEREYDPQSLQSNIAMVEFDGVVKVTETVRPACFPTRTIANAQVRPGSIGQAPVTRKDDFIYQKILYIPISDQGQCRDQCAREPTITEFCGFHNQGFESQLTPSDSGTGLFFSDAETNMSYLQGIVSKVAVDVNGCPYHDTFTSVNVFLDWINKVHDELAKEGKIQESSEVEHPLPQIPKPSDSNIVDNVIHDDATYLQPPPPPPPPPILHRREESSEISLIGLNLHNYYRQLHQAPPLQLNPALSKEAKEWAQYLLYQNKWGFSDQSNGYSQNIFQYFGNISNVGVTRKAVDNWYQSIHKYDWDYPDATTFSQLVWRSTKEIGIGVASSPGKSVVVANYWPKGNIYNIGTGERGKYFRDNVLPLQGSL